MSDAAPPPPGPDAEMLLDRAASVIEAADALLIAAGAGIGVDSGLPDFRGSQGFWRAYPALARARIDFEAAASPELFRTDPTLAWGFYGHRLKLYRETVPHEGFAQLLAWAGAKPGGGFVNTSNVDGQFQKAGFEASQMCEVHGSIQRLQCSEACRSEYWPADEFLPVVDEESGRLLNAPPICPRCGALARPNILMFGDWQWVAGRTELQCLRRDQWLAQAGKIAIIEVGAGIHLPTIRSFTERLCRLGKAQAVRINPRQPEISPRLGVGLRMSGLAGLQALAARLGG